MQPSKASVLEATNFLKICKNVCGGICQLVFKGARQQSFRIKNANFLMVDQWEYQDGKDREIEISKMIKTGARELEGANSEFEANILTF